MDSDSSFTLDRPHISVLDATQFVGLFDRKSAAPPAALVSGEDDEFIQVIRRRLDIGIKYPVSSNFPEIQPKETFIPVNIVNQIKDPLSFDVYPRDGKRRRNQNDTMIFSIRVMQFQDTRAELQVLDQLQMTSKRNKMVEHWRKINWPMLHLWVEETHADHYIINGEITYSLVYRNAPEPCTFMLDVPGIRSLMEYLVPLDPQRKGVSPKLLYDAMSRPHGLSKEKFSVPNMNCELLPYQRETVRWLLRQEGKLVQPDGSLEEYSDDTFPEWKPWGEYLCNPYSGCVTSFKKLVQYRSEYARILLAEEMGLGKTVETIATMLLNKRPEGPERVYDPHLNREVYSAKGTLIISPQSIALQWKDEIKQHSPSLSVLVYKGRGTERGDVLARRLASYDVVITNYRVISQEVHYAFYNPPMTVRSHVAKKRDVEGIQSPLVQTQFWRIILDEVQMVSSGVSAAAMVAKTIPRVHSWGVTGTPIHKTMADLQGILNFLRYEPYASSKFAWQRLTTSPEDFETLFKYIGIRHTRAMVKDDLAIPNQSRVLVPLSFNQIEANNYSHLFSDFLKDCEVDHEGNSTTTDSRAPDASLLAHWLVRLRQACCHARIGVNKKALGGRPMNTMSEVLEAMVEQARSTLLGNQRRYFVSMIERGQLREEEKNPEAALEIWSDALREIEKIVDEIKLDAKLDDEDEVERSNSRIRLRSWHELMHRCLFFIGSAHFQLHNRVDPVDPVEPRSKESKDDKEPVPVPVKDVEPKKELTEEEQKFVEEHKALESEFYDKAQKLRSEMLQEPMGKVQAMIDRLDKKLKDKGIENKKLRWDFDEDDMAGLETRSLVTKFDSVVKALAEQRGDVVKEWRGKVIDYLSASLVDQSANPDGDEYQDSLDDQEYLFVYLEALQKAIADRSAAVTGAADVMTTKVNLREVRLEVSELDKLIEMKRNKLRFEVELNGTLGSIVSQVKELKHVLPETERGKTEWAIAEDIIPVLNDHFNAQKEDLKKLNKDFNLLNDLYNVRVDYYRQLQALSDSVTALAEDHEGDFDSRLKEEEALMKEINQQLGRMRYLVNIEMNPEQERTCVICQMTYYLGSWTVCGHDFCRDCLTEWWNTRHTCPICKRVLRRDEVYNYLMSSGDVDMKIDQINEVQLASSADELYSELPADTVRKISQWPTESLYRFGTKIDFIIRHLLWLRSKDPTAQVVVFSQWKEMLELIEQSLEDNGIRYATVNERMLEFKRDPNVACFLLHAKSQSSGLTLVNAAHVYLVEPLVNIALESQAISRIHRIGQTKETTVWSFIIGNTVEEQILKLSTQKRHALSAEEMVQGQTAQLVEKKSAGGEVVTDHDLRTVLFAKSLEPINSKSEKS